MSLKSKVITASAVNMLANIITLASSIIIARHLDLDEYGVYRKVLLILAFFATIASFGMNSSLLTILPGAQDKVSLFSKVSFNIVLCASVLASFFLFEFKSVFLGDLALNFNSWLFAIMPIFIFGSAYLAIRQAFNIHADKRIFYAINSAGPSLVSGLGLIYLSITSFGWSALVTWVCLVYGFFAILNILAVSKNREAFRAKAQDYIDVVKTSAPMFFVSLLGLIGSQLDKYIIAINWDSRASAVYFIGATEIPFLTVISGTASAIIMNEAAKSIRSGAYAEAIMMFRKSALYGSVVLFPVTVIGWEFSSEIILGVFGNKYIESVSIFSIFMCILPIRIVLFGPFMYALELSKVVLTRSIIELILIGGGAIALGNKFGITGVALSNAIVIILFTVPWNLWFLRKKLRMPIFFIIPFKKLGVSMGGALLCSALSRIGLDLLDQYKPSSTFKLIYVMASVIMTMIVLKIINNIQIRSEKL